MSNTKDITVSYDSNDVVAIDQLGKDEPINVFVHRKFPSIGIDILTDVEAISFFGSEGSNGYFVVRRTKDRRVIYPIHDIYKIEVNPTDDI